VDRGIEVLLFSDPVDDVWLGQQPPEYKGKKWQSVGLGEVELGTEEEKRKAEEERKQDEDAFGKLLTTLRAAVQDEVTEVRLSNRLTSSPACLVREEGELSPQMAEMLRSAGQDVPVSKPTLEINPTHPLLVKLLEICEQDATDPRIAEYAHLLYGQSMLAEGRNLDDPAAFSRRVAELMTSSLAASQAGSQAG
jgi:molecular chaperone HtpG